LFAVSASVIAFSSAFPGMLRIRNRRFIATAADNPKFTVAHATTTKRGKAPTSAENASKWNAKRTLALAH
jgi:hypothetical protein